VKLRCNDGSGNKEEEEISKLHLFIKMCQRRKSNS